MRPIILNIVLFQLGWFACVLGGASEYAWLGSAIVLLILAAHLTLAVDTRTELYLILATVVIGTTWDSLLTATGTMSFTQGVMIEGMAPHWLIAMWALFATTLNISMRWLKGRILLSMLLGAVGGPLAYFAGNRLGAVEFNDTTVSLIIIAIGWSIIMPLLVSIANSHDGFPQYRRTVDA